MSIEVNNNNNSIQRAYLGGAAAVAIAVSVSVGPVAAQQGPEGDVSPNVSVEDRYNRSIQSLGVRAGGFTVLPRAVLDMTYDDNIFVAESDTTDDIIASATGELAARSNWSRHGLNGRASVTRREFFDNGSESTTDYRVGGDGYLSFGANNRASVDASYARLTERRSELQTAFNSINPVRFNVVQAGGRLDFSQTRFRETIGVFVRHQNFDDGIDRDTDAEIDQDFRDRTTYSVYGRQYVRVSPGLEAFGQVRGDWLRSPNPQPGVGADQDASGYTVNGGVAFDIRKVARGEFGVGYQTRNFDNDEFVDIEGVNIEGEVEAFVTGLTTVKINADRKIVPSAILGAGGFILSNYRVKVDHELFSNIIVTAGGEYRGESFRGLDRENKYKSFNAGVKYAFRPEVLFGVGYQYADLNSDGAQRRTDFTANRVMMTLELRR